MKGLRKFGAMALAAALSLTLIAPVNANAAYQEAAGPSFSQRYSGISEVDQIKENKDASGKVVSYTDITTGATAAESADLIDYTAPKKMQIEVNDWQTLHVYLGNGNCEIRNVKSSNKKVIKANLSKNFSKYTTTDKISVHEENGQYYYYDGVSGKKTIVANKDAAPNASEGRYHITLKASKEGKATISYDVYDNTGNKTETVKIKVTAKEVAPFASVTFAGKSLIHDRYIGATNANALGIKYVSNTTTKKSGKVKIKMNKGYKLVKVITGTENGYVVKPDDVTAPYYGEDAEQIKSEFKSDFGTFSNYYTWTDRGASKSFKLALSTTPSSYGYSKYGKTGEEPYEHLYSREGYSSSTPIYIYFVDKSTNKLYRFNTTITRRLIK
ncbi:hypothetical protein [Butyrivibrio sp. LC3010]|uniref:hypothetical protein n=1 Tax=Butyrivibrio sp. LC3010 TaxID=1280680 RepID=UPI0003FA9526|nr:hypothetical protein [Butyrivibrio sp. LC3010]